MSKTHQNKNKYRIGYLAIFALLIAMVLLKTSCKKNNVTNNEEKNYDPKVIESKFFQYNAPISKESKSVYDYLYNINQQSPFAIETAKKKNENFSVASYSVFGVFGVFVYWLYCQSQTK